ncbi:peptidyl-tRNA hydrolase [Marasmius fiardii PR-910]|nr:peptidyl-tRNA hydrolase [Marasmius fiardii PR-910]
MSTGKIAAQCSHATLACYKSLLSSNSTVRFSVLEFLGESFIVLHCKILRRWEKSGQSKVALRCSNEEELLTLQAQAQSLNLCARSIQDAGRTQIAVGSRTVLGILGPVRLVNRITGTLRLL